MSHWFGCHVVLTAHNNPLIVPCEACGSEGRIYWLTGCVERETGAPLEDSKPCIYCDGTGGEEIEGQPLELEDAEFLANGGRHA